MIDQYSWQLIDVFHARRDYEVAKNINKLYERICIVGMLPIPIALAFGKKVTIVNDSVILHHYSGQLKHLFDFDVVSKNPLFDDIQPEIDNSDIVVYHDSEFLVPLNLMYHKHKDRDVLIMNTYDPQYKHCVNYAYSKEDLLDLYPMKQLYSSGKVPFVNDLYTNWIYGKIDD